MKRYAPYTLTSDESTINRFYVKSLPQAQLTRLFEYNRGKMIGIEMARTYARPGAYEKELTRTWTMILDVVHRLARRIITENIEHETALYGRDENISY